MPVKRVLLDDLENTVAVIERTHRIVEVVNSGDGAVIVFTAPLDDVEVASTDKRAAGRRETRADVE